MCDRVSQPDLILVCLDNRHGYTTESLEHLCLYFYYKKLNHIVYSARCYVNVNLELNCSKRRYAKNSAWWSHCNTAPFLPSELDTNNVLKVCMAKDRLCTVPLWYGPKVSVSAYNNGHPYLQEVLFFHLSSVSATVSGPLASRLRSSKNVVIEMIFEDILVSFSFIHLHSTSLGWICCILFYCISTGSSVVFLSDGCLFVLFVFIVVAVFKCCPLGQVSLEKEILISTRSFSG